MFDRLLFWLREKARLLFGENTTVSASVSYSMENAIILWAQMYDTGGPWCHGGKNALHSLKLADGHFVTRIYGVADNPKEGRFLGGSMAAFGNVWDCTLV